MNLYCQLPFGKLHKGTAEVVQLAMLLDRSPSSVSMKLCNLASLDPINIERGVKGLSSVSSADRGIWEEFHNDWDGLVVESETIRQKFELNTDSDDEVRHDSINGFDGATETTRLVQVRLTQQFFRRSVLASFNCQCCISGISIPELLIASHIVPWSQFPQHRANPRNGLCLSRLHDGAFDLGLITIDEEMKLVISKSLRDHYSNTVMQVSFQAFEGKPICLPNRFRPDSELLAAHRQTIFRS
ncbi:MAG: HNH endonuclease [Planctomycetes bacterium]|nr:HNH endonuclease [Planctomycetota bacterium]